VFYEPESNGMYDFASVEVMPSIKDRDDLLAMYELKMTEFKGHYTNVLFICSSMVYAFITKLLFKVS
jgi:hypothetical protein